MSTEFMLRCPKCDGSNIKVKTKKEGGGQKIMKFIHVFTCKKCGHVWEERAGE